MTEAQTSPVELVVTGPGKVVFDGLSLTFVAADPSDLDGFWAPLVDDLAGRVKRAEEDSDRLYRYVLTGGDDRDDLVRLHIEARYRH